MDTADTGTASGNLYIPLPYACKNLLSNAKVPLSCMLGNFTSPAASSEGTVAVVDENTNNIYIAVIDDGSLRDYIQANTVENDSRIHISGWYPCTVNYLL